jgi:hypothetical protein
MRFLESDADISSLIDHLRTSTPLGRLNNIEAHSVFKTISQLGYRLALPDSHPSGLRSTEMPITSVTPIGSGMNRPATRR